MFVSTSTCFVLDANQSISFLSDWPVDLDLAPLVRDGSSALAAVFWVLPLRCELRLALSQQVVTHQAIIQPTCRVLCLDFRSSLHSWRDYNQGPINGGLRFFLI
jgi:hypothetical protein